MVSDRKVGFITGFSCDAVWHCISEMTPRTLHFMRVQMVLSYLVVLSCSEGAGRFLVFA